MKVTVIPIAVGAPGTFSKGLEELKSKCKKYFIKFERPTKKKDKITRRIFLLS